MFVAVKNGKLLASSPFAKNGLGKSTLPIVSSIKLKLFESNNLVFDGRYWKDWFQRESLCHWQSERKWFRYSLESISNRIFRYNINFGIRPLFSVLFEINFNRLKDIIVLKNAKKINASQIEDLLMQCLETTGEICVKAKPNENNYDDIHAFIYARYEFK